MSDYLITVEAPQRPRRGDNRLIVVVTDSQGSPVYRNRVDINEENFRTKVVERISQKTGDDPGDIDRRLLQGLAQLQPPSKAAVPEVSAEGNWPYEATPEGLIRKKETDDGGQEGSGSSYGDPANHLQCPDHRPGAGRRLETRSS